MSRAAARAHPKAPPSDHLLSSVPIEPRSVASLLPAKGPRELPTTRDLLLQALLHLPRIARRNGTIDEASAIDEIERLRTIRGAELAPLRSLSDAPRVLPELNELEVRVIDPVDAAQVLGHFHYLRSYRPDSLTFGAVYQDRVVAMCSISPLDLPGVADELPIGDAREARVVSRVFAFDWAPRNVVSYMLARAEGSRRVIGEEVRLLLTYLNPNMGFSGASYKAANWRPLGIETGTRYTYLNGRYITDRQVCRLPAEDQASVEYSRMQLRPLVLLCRLLDKRLQRAYPQGLEVVVERPEAPL